MAPADKFVLYDTATGRSVGDVEVRGLDVFFPDFVRGWSDVLDCRIPPYDERSVDENCDFAAGVRKFYILVKEPLAGD